MKSLSKLRHYLKLMVVFARISLLNQLEYRLNFIAGTCVEIGYMLIKLVYLAVVLKTGVNVGDLTPDMVILFVGIYIFMTGIWMFLQGINDLPWKIYSGSLDLMIVKPGSLIFLQSFSSFSFSVAVPDILAGIILICVGWARIGIPVTFPLLGGFVFFIAMGIFLTYSIISVCMLLAFWVTSFGGIFTFFAALWDFNIMPMRLYNKVFQQIGTFIIPIFLLTNWAGLFVLDKLTAVEIVWGIALPIGLFLLSDFMWKRGIRRYTSANG